MQGARFLAQLSPICHQIHLVEPNYKNMKKATVLVAAIALLGITSVDTFAQGTQNNTQQTQTQTQTEDANKEKITQEELPQPVKDALTKEIYQAWTVSEVYKVAAAEGAKPTYEVQFTNASDERAVARFNEDGTTIKSKE